MEYHCDNPAKAIEKPLKSANMAEVVSQWDADYVDVEQDILFELILVRPCCRFLCRGFSIIHCDAVLIGGKLHGYQTVAGPHMCESGVHDQG